MSVLPEAFHRPNPAESLAESVSRRYAELTALTTDFSCALEVVGDMNRVNDTIANSDRPDLVLHEPVGVMPVDTLDDIRRINNFYPNMTAFGMRIFGPDEKLPSGRIIRPALGRKQLTDEELRRYFLMGARGEYDEHFAFASEQGIDKDEAMDMFMQTHLGKESFMRMWILFPDLTRTLMTRCLSEDLNKTKPIKEEVFVAYNLMARLVDRNDMYVMGEDGEIDKWALCH